MALNDPKPEDLIGPLMTWTKALQIDDILDPNLPVHERASIRLELERAFDAAFKIHLDRYFTLPAFRDQECPKLNSMDVEFARIISESHGDVNFDLLELMTHNLLVQSFEQLMPRTARFVREARQM